MGRQYMRWFLASLEPLLRSFGSEDREPNIQQLLFIGVVDHQALPHISYEYCSCAKLQHGSNSRGILNFHHLTLMFLMVSNRRSIMIVGSRVHTSFN